VVVSSVIVVQFEEFLARDPIIGWDTKTSLEEKEPLLELEERITLWIRNYRPEEFVFRKGTSDRFENAAVEFYHRDGTY
jgi:hypothetical protein